MSLLRKKTEIWTTFIGSLTVGIALKDLYSSIHSLLHTPEDQFELLVTASHRLYVSYYRIPKTYMCLDRIITVIFIFVGHIPWNHISNRNRNGHLSKTYWNKWQTVNVYTINKIDLGQHYFFANNPQDRC